MGSSPQEDNHWLEMNRCGLALVETVTFATPATTTIGKTRSKAINVTFVLIAFAGERRLPHAIVNAITSTGSAYARKALVPAHLIAKLWFTSVGERELVAEPSAIVQLAIVAFCANQSNRQGSG